jgi:hypothetical protein
MFWIPYVILRVETAPRRTVAFSALGRVKAGVSLAQAEAEGTSAARSMPRPMSADLFFGKGGPPVVHARPLADDLTFTVRPALQVLAASVALVLLVACAHVANLFLSRGVARQRELAVRAAIGAGRARIAQQLLTESVVLSLGGGLGGLLLAWMLVRLLPAFAPEGFPRLADVRLDGRVIAFALAASIFTAVAAGLAPAVRGARFRLSESLQAETARRLAASAGVERGGFATGCSFSSRHSRSSSSSARRCWRTASSGSHGWMRATTPITC